MSYKTGYIHDEEYNELYGPDVDQCSECANKAMTEGLCKDHWEEKELEEMAEME